MSRFERSDVWLVPAAVHRSSKMQRNSHASSRAHRAAIGALQAHYSRVALLIAALQQLVGDKDRTIGEVNTCVSGYSANNI
ncbi:MAG TPA: hypothetical protein VM639_14125 [Dongiaceae bacterium]|nr:hypothetical protein [Dongiaceae bacterium]